MDSFLRRVALRTLQINLNINGSCATSLRMFCRPLWHHPKNPPVQFGNIRKSIPTPRNLLSTALASPEKCFSAILENSEVASSTSELVVDCFCVCEHSAKARAKGLRSARTDIVVFLAFISKSRSGGCPAAQGLEMKAIFTSRIFQKNKNEWDSYTRGDSGILGRGVCE